MSDSEYQTQENKDDRDKKLADSYCKKFETLKSERSNWDPHVQEVLDYCIPNKADVTSTKIDGGKRGNELFSTVQIHALELLTAFIHWVMCNPSKRFIEATSGDPEVDSDEEVRGYLSLVGEKIFQALSATNFQTEVHETLTDVIVGTGCLYMGAHEENFIHFSSRPFKEIYIDENNLGMVDTVYRRFEWKPRQIIQEFGEKNMHPTILKRYYDGVEDKFSILHAVHPYERGEKSPKGHLIKSCYIVEEDKIILNEDGYEEMPYAVPRWSKTSGEKYGRGPAMQMLPDIKMHDVMMETTIQGAQLTTLPPFAVMDDGIIGKVKLTPAGMTVVRKGYGEDMPIKPLVTDARIDFGFQMVNEIRRAIRSGFFVDQFQLPTGGPQMTAAETSQRTEEQLRLMGPVGGRLFTELNDPVFTRMFGAMFRKGKLPEPPSLLKGKRLTVKLSSEIARAQRMSDGQNFVRAIQTAAPIINAKPDCLDLIDTDEALKYILFDTFGVSTKVERPSREVAKIREARAKAQEQMAQQEQAQHQADVFSKTGGAVAQLQAADTGQGNA